MPQRGKSLVKISVRTECRWVNTFSMNGELAERASNSGSRCRMWSQTRTARSAPLTATWTWRPNELFRQTTQRRISSFRR
jgi:hypothetical protein